jgi:hypothetical protein
MGGQAMNPQREVDRLLDRWLGRVSGANEALRKDARYAAEFSFMRRMLTALDIVMEDEGIPEQTRLRIIRTLVYGAPDEAAALARMDRLEAEVERLKWTPPLMWPGEFGR